MRVVILGAGFGGLELASALSEQFGSSGEAEVVLVDKADGFVFGFSKLDVMFGHAPAEHVRHRYSDIVKPGVDFVQAEILAIDPVAKTVKTTGGPISADVLVIALGADLDPAATPGLVEGGSEFYTVEGAFETSAALERFAGGRVVVAVTSTPFKCPPAPSETALMTHDYLVSRGLRDISQISLVMPLGSPVPPSPQASKAILDAFSERGIAWHPEALVRALDPDRRVAILTGGQELDYDLFLGVPTHRAPAVVVDSGLTEDGWIPVDPQTMRTRFPDVFAIGDVASVGTPKAGVFAEGQAAVVASAIAARLGAQAPVLTYDGHGICYMEFGLDMIAKVDVTFLSGARPVGALEGPSLALAADKAHFGTSRARRWFGNEWSARPTPLST